MPCYDPETTEGPPRMRAKIHNLTKLLCELCGKVDKAKVKIEVSQYLHDWWEHHKEVDALLASRLEKEKQGLEYRHMTDDRVFTEP